MPFALDGNPTNSEISEAVNYILANLSQSVNANASTGQITGPTGTITGYLYKYLAVKYADSFDGTLNFSNSPTGRSYYGIRNSNSSTESTNPVDYTWTQVTGGFGTTKFFYYLTTGGRQIQIAVATAVPNPGWVIDNGTSIDLDITNATNSVANFVVIRVPNNSAAPTDAECITAIGRTPISGDLCTVNYNSGIFSIVYKYTTGWAIFQKYITGDLIVANSIVANNIAANTITANEIAAATISANNMAANSITAANGAIANAAITNAKIGTAEVSTLSIAGNAVTVLAAAAGGASGTSITLSLTAGQPVLINTTVDGSTDVTAPPVRNSYISVSGVGLIRQVQVTNPYFSIGFRWAGIVGLALFTPSTTSSYTITVSADGPSTTTYITATNCKR